MEPQKTPAQQPPNDEALPNTPDAPASDTTPTGESSDSIKLKEALVSGKDEQIVAESGDVVATEAAAGQTFKPDAPASQSGDDAASKDAPPMDAQDEPPQGETKDIPEPETAPNPLPVGSPKRGKKSLIIGLIVAAALLLISGGVAAAYYYVVNKPENVLKQALANAVDTDKSKTVHFSGAVNVEEKDSEMTVAVDFKGEADNKAPAASLSGSVDLLVTKLTFDLRTLDSKTFYARLGGLEGVPELLSLTGGEAAGYAPLVGSLNDQWIEINESLLKQVDSSYQSSPVSEADTQKVIEAYLGNPFLVVDEVLPAETVAGESCYHYKLAIEPAKLKAFLAAIKDVKSLNITQKILDEANKEIDKADFKKYPLEVWISKGDKMFKQLAVEFEDQGARVNVRLTVDSYNKPVNIQKPEDSKSLMEIMGGLLTGSLTMPTSLVEQSGISL